MSDKRVLTEHELKLIAGVLGYHLVKKFKVGVDNRKNCIINSQNSLHLWDNDSKYFDSLHNHADLARLVEAMRQARYNFSWSAYNERFRAEDGLYQCEVSFETLDAWTSTSSNTFIKATCFACVEALVEKEKRDADG